MRALLSPACGVVQEVCAGIVHQCSCIGALDLGRIQPAHWACSSSSSSNSLQQHLGQLQQQRGKHTVRMVLLKVGTTHSYFFNSLARLCLASQSSANMARAPTTACCSLTSTSGSGQSAGCITSMLTPAVLCCAQDMKHLGSKGDIVEVKAGHARHHLFPNREADYAVSSLLKRLKVRPGGTSSPLCTRSGTLVLPCSGHTESGMIVLLSSSTHGTVRTRTLAEKDTRLSASHLEYSPFLILLADNALLLVDVSAGAWVLECPGPAAAAARCQKSCCWCCR
jgi:hypothetical protein